MAERPFKTVRFVAADRSADDRAYVEPEVSFSPGEAPDLAALARHYLVRVLELETASDVSFDVGATPAAAPEVELANVQASKLTATSVVRFTQARAAIPIFGSHMVVELDGAGKLVGVDAELAAVHDVSPAPTLDPTQAAARLAAFVGVGDLEIAAPVLHYYHEDDEDGDRWHLVWVFRDVPAAPPEIGHGHAGRGHGRSPRTRAPRMHYLVDAHDGAIVLYYSAAPRVAAATPEVPIRCFGVDELGVRHEFYGRAVDGGFSLQDPLRGLQTLDLAGGDISVEPIRLPKTPIRHAKAEFGAEHAAAVAAHVNVARVLDFYRSILLRDSVDDKGMEIVSVVHCISSEDEDPPDWGNAIWWNGRMWYGQMRNRDGEVRSLSGYLDIIAHELTHGLIEHTADLLYKSQSGALNESLCDIFGAIVANWYQVGPDSDTGKWTWQIGPGLGEDGKAIRDLADPARTGDPGHMNDYLRTRHDDGGVHTNSNIHNKAAYHLLTATDSKGDKQLTPREVAMLYYMCLMRLPQRATFARTLRGLLDVAKTYFAGDPTAQARKLAAIEKAYAKVGIVLEVED